MYAIVKTGGKQHKVAVGDVIEVEKVDGAAGDAGDAARAARSSTATTVTTDAAALKAMSVTAEVVGAHQGPEDPHPQVQEQDRLPQAPGPPSAADAGPRHRHRAAGE